ncbi:hypothetical protein AVEN_118215-1 [Araneus ventricosus]|uniref:Uncharacterized protein n=1 Tax=Araneus ventricosus TaxID=182803 RepID=A0A4Y2PRF0_ARAVE|nr:hypothetical protein AVEN_118215-1 [Araneus ventricosus]
MLESKVIWVSRAVICGEIRQGPPPVSANQGNFEGEPQGWDKICPCNAISASIEKLMDEFCSRSERADRRSKRSNVGTRTDRISRKGSAARGDSCGKIRFTKSLESFDLVLQLGGILMCKTLITLLD